MEEPPAVTQGADTPRQGVPGGSPPHGGCPEGGPMSCVGAPPLAPRGSSPLPTPKGSGLTSAVLSAGFLRSACLARGSTAALIAERSWGRRKGGGEAALLPAAPGSAAGLGAGAPGSGSASRSLHHRRRFRPPPAAAAHRAAPAAAGPCRAEPRARQLPGPSGTPRASRPRTPPAHKATRAGGEVGAAEMRLSSAARPRFAARFGPAAPPPRVSARSARSVPSAAAAAPVSHPPPKRGKNARAGPLTKAISREPEGRGLWEPLPSLSPRPSLPRGGAGRGAARRGRLARVGRGAAHARGGCRGVPAQRRLRGLRGSGNGGLGVGSLRPFLAPFFALIPFGRQIKHTSPSHTAFLGRGLVLLTSMMSSLPCCCPQCVPQPHLIKYLHI